VIPTHQLQEKAAHQFEINLSETDFNVDGGDMKKPAFLTGV